MFCQATPDETFERTTSLLSATAPFRHYVISSGCDLPPNTSLANLGAFYDAVRILAAGAAPDQTIESDVADAWSKGVKSLYPL
jgi:hypothetical protein